MPHVYDRTERYTIAQIRDANMRAGFHFFERDTMRFFDSRVVKAGPYCGPGGVFFITSEQFHGSQGDGPRGFTVRQFKPDSGDVDSASDFNTIRDVDDARRLARQWAQGGVLDRGRISK